MITDYLGDIIILLMAAVIAVPLFQAIKFGAVPGFLIAGVIVGPSGLGLISKVSEIGRLAEIGVVLLLFVIGIELKPSRLWLMRRLVFGLGTFQVLFTGGVLSAVTYYFFNTPVQAAILIGPALALSSTAFVLQLLIEQKILTSIYGRTSFAVLLLQDLAVVPLLALVPLLAMPEFTIGQNIGLALAESLLILFLVIFIGRYLLHPVLHRVALSRNPEIFTASALLIVLGIAMLTEHIGFSMAMGAFLAGLLISDSAYKHQVMAEVQPFRGLLLGLFFMSMGMSLNLNLFLEHPVLSLGMMGLLISLKIIILFPLAYLFRFKLRDSLAVALVLAQSGEFALVLFSFAHQSNLLTDNLFQHLLLVVLLSMLATPLLVYFAQLLIRSQNIDRKANADNIESPVAAPIVIAGFGRVGHRIGEILSLANQSFVALDADVSVVEKERAKGHSVFYGDVRIPEVLKSAGVGNAKFIIVTLNDPEATEQVIHSLRKTHPDTIIYARGHSLDQCRELRVLGASAVVSENVETSLELARMILMKTDVSDEQRESLIHDFRQKYHNQISEAIDSAKMG
ncbi:MAG: monovalent cation:proton antiporter-2 (CPA2) family protein [Gammaproteobacteria bacterium]|nr:monovalent cation:proton antiporter-2 (CPA2) family protein [Gammaproteobacteria bacterium]